ncbi:MAG: hypothetical protein JXR52_09240 [Bacteroidales bacterium]|nr:hypothetical protein [Bacteroidales bacterium]MBN2698999.1 hypothetical protein [Bacteroidales bacterium]
MVRPIIICASVISLLLAVFCSRSPLEVDISGIEYNLEIKRFDMELLDLKPDSIEDAITDFYTAYGDFFDVYNVHVLNIGPASHRRYPSYLSMFINDPLNREVMEYTGRIFTDMSDIRLQLENGFKRYMVHYPDSLPPEIVTYVSGFNQGLLIVSRTVGVGLDQYLGRDCAYYDLLGIAEYLQYNKYPGRIPPDVFYAWATAIHPYNDSVDNVLNRMIHEGLLLYFTKAMLPGIQDSTLMGFTPEQMIWCLNNEKQMWTHLVEHKLLFSTDILDIRKLIDNAPYTQFYTTDSPGRAAAWQGWQIVRAYAERNSGMSLREIMAVTDYQSILRQSRYNP